MTIGTEGQNRILIKALGSILAARPRVILHH
jgi:hypothetical protein